MFGRDVLHRKAGVNRDVLHRKGDEWWTFLWCFLGGVFKRFFCLMWSNGLNCMSFTGVESGLFTGVESGLLV